MLKNIQICFVFLLIFLASYGFAYAQDLVINEVFANPSGSTSEQGEFIELKNNSESDINLEGYTLNEAKTFLITSKTVPANSYISFFRSDTKLALNNSGDTVTLKDPSGNIIDSFTFNETVEDKSWSRFPDGTGVFYNETVPSPDKENNTPPNPTTVPTDTPTPTSLPTPTYAPSSTSTPSPEPSEQVVNIEKPEPDIKGESTSQIMTATSSDDDLIENESIDVVPLLFVAAGFIFIAAGVYLFIRRKK